MATNIAWSNQFAAKRSRVTIWLIVLLMISAIVWASWAQLDEVVVGEATVVPSTSVQSIASLEGGIVRQLLVEEGQTVVRGELLAVIDDTRFKAAFQESQSQTNTLKAQQQRLRLELNSVQLDLASNDWQQQVLVEKLAYPNLDTTNQTQLNEAANYRSRLNQLIGELEEAKLRIEQQQQAYNEALSSERTLNNSLTVLKQEMSLIEEVVASGAVAEVELLKLKRDIIALEGDIATTSTSVQRQLATLNEQKADYRSLAQEFRVKSQAQLNDVESQLEQFSQSQSALRDQLERTQVLAPVDGVVKEIFIRTLGGVARPGEPILEIIPQNARLIVEAHINPKDIAFISNGLRALVKFSAYDFIVYGGATGEVTYVSGDVLQTEEGTPYYRTHIEVEPESMPFEVIPGMQGTVDIMTGKKTVMQYWLKPLLRAKENSLRER